MRGVAGDREVHRRAGGKAVLDPGLPEFDERIADKSQIVSGRFDAIAGKSAIKSLACLLLLGRGIRRFCRVRAFLCEGRPSIADDEKEIQCEDDDEVGEKSQHSDDRYPDVLGFHY